MKNPRSHTTVELYEETDRLLRKIEALAESRLVSVINARRKASHMVDDINRELLRRELAGLVTDKDRDIERAINGIEV